MHSSNVTSPVRGIPLRLLLTLLIVHALSASCIFAAEDVVVRPKPAPGALDNPLKGWCPYPDAGPIHQPYSMVFRYVSWRELEPIEGQFRFEQWERSWDVERAKGKHIVFRVYIDYPGKPSGLPEWLRNAGVKETDYSDHGGGKSPDYDDPRMVAGMERLISALGKRYNSHPRVAFIQLGLLGYWGEWHTWPNDKLYASPATERRVIDAYRKAFPDKRLMVRYAKRFAGQQEWIGFHDDLFPEDTDNGEPWSFLAVMRTAKRTENWRTSVIGGEMVPNKARHWIGERFDTTMTMTERTHFTFVGPYCPALENPNDDEFRKRSVRLVRRMGYDFQVTKLVHSSVVKAQAACKLSLSGKNIGVAPFYYPWSVEWALIDDSGKVVATCETDWDIRKWQPGEFAEQTNLKFNVPAGTYRLGVGFRDPSLDRPSIRLANELMVKEGWNILSTIQIVD